MSFLKAILHVVMDSNLFLSSIKFSWQQYFLLFLDFCCFRNLNCLKKIKHETKLILNKIYFKTKINFLNTVSLRYVRSISWPLVLVKPSLIYSVDFKESLNKQDVDLHKQRVAVYVAQFSSSWTSHPTNIGLDCKNQLG